MIPFLPQLIGLAAGGLGAIFHKKSPAEDAQGNIFGNIPGEISTGNAATSGGLGDLDQAGNFYKTILGGSADATEKLLGPQVNTIMKQYDNAAKVASNLGPRGGGKASGLVEAQTGKAGAYSKVLGDVLPQAAEGVAGVGKAKAAVGSNLLGSVNGLGGPVSNAVTQGNAQNAGAFSTLGSGLGKWLAGMITNKGKGNGTPVSNTPTDDNWDTTGVG